MHDPVPPVCVWLKRDLLATAGLVGCRDLGQPADTKDRQRGGEAAAAAVLDDFLIRRGRSYSGGISSPLSAPTSCSRLSPFLAYGAISLRTVWQACEARRMDVTAELATAATPRERAELKAWQRSLTAVQSRLHWHCHFMQKLEDEPAIEFHNMLRAADGLREHDVSHDRLAAWQAGRTGYPLVDACMRSLLATGWLTFRMRAMVVSFASYSLWLHWRPTGPRAHALDDASRGASSGGLRDRPRLSGPGPAARRARAGPGVGRDGAAPGR